MKQLHFLHSVIALATLAGVSAVGRSPDRNIVGPSPAELEEQEEEDGADVPQQVQQKDDPPSSPVQVVVQSPPMPRSSWVEATAPAGVPSLDASFGQNPTWPKSSEAYASDPGSMPSFQDQERSSSPFLPYSEANDQPQEALPEKKNAGENLEVQRASELSRGAVELSRGAAIRDGASANFLKSHADLGLAALSATASSMPSLERPQRVLPTTFPRTVPGMPVSYSDETSVKSLFPPGLPQSMKGPSPPEVGKSSSFRAESKASFTATMKEHGTCHPPCIQGRGVCNDNLCFCKTPFRGTTCQHKMSNYSRVKYPMLVAASAVCVVLGMLAAQIIHGFFARANEKRLVRLGDGAVRQELWTPPENTKKKSGG